MIPVLRTQRRNVVNTKKRKRRKMEKQRKEKGEVKERKERPGHNPRTGETMTIARSKAPVFKAGSALKAVVNK